MAGVDGCFHLAAVASVQRGNEDWLGTHRVNLTGTIAVFDAARTCKQGAGAGGVRVFGGGLWRQSEYAAERECRHGAAVGLWGG